eukprot:1173935-Rhodomonas_salina.3
MRQAATLNPKDKIQFEWYPSSVPVMLGFVGSDHAFALEADPFGDDDGLWLCSIHNPDRTITPQLFMVGLLRFACLVHFLPVGPNWYDNDHPPIPISVAVETPTPQMMIGRALPSSWLCTETSIIIDNTTMMFCPPKIPCHDLKYHSIEAY